MLRSYSISPSLYLLNNVKILGIQTRHLLTKHGKVNIRGLIRDFYKQVHPDLTRFSSLEAKSVNEKSLAELNSYVDLLEKALTEQDTQEELVIQSKTLNFFKSYRSYFGEIHPERCIPFTVFLPTLRTLASHIEKEAIALSVIHELGKQANAIDSSFSASPKPNPIFSAKYSDRRKLTELWDTMTYETMHKSSMFEPESFCIRNSTKSAHLNGKSCKKYYPFYQPEYNGNLNNFKNSNWDDEFSIIDAGFHPDLLFYYKKISHQELEEAKNRLKGSNLTNEADIWLLYNTLKVLRDSKPPISIMIIPKNSRFSTSRFGTLMIPSNFDLWQLVEYLEKNLDNIKRKRENIFQELRKCDE